MKKKYLWGMLLICVIAAGWGARPLAEYGLERYLTGQSQRIAGLSADLNRARFHADTTGDNAYYQEAQQLQMQLTSHYQSPLTCWRLGLLKQSGLIKNPLLKRELALVHLDFLSSRGDKKRLDAIIAGQTAIEQTFTVFRPRWQGEPVSNQFLHKILHRATREDELSAAWMAGCQVGAQVGPDLLALVKLRNEMARQQGYRDYFQMQLALNEQNGQQLDAVFQAVDQLTRQEYQLYKQEMDQVLARRYTLSTQQLKPWHYQQIFLQQAPPACEVRLDPYYARTDITRAVARYFEDLGMPGEQVIQASDLKPRSGKYPYAYCIDIDRAGDVRILANLGNDADSAQTLLHEMGHAIYDLQIDPTLPWRLREPASIGLTEGIAMMFGDMATDPDWLQRYLGLTDEERQAIEADCLYTRRLNDLIFCRWALVMYEFEKELYANPGPQLDQYWWQLVQRYQLVAPPAQPPPYAWAAKVHLATSPVYYYQYILGRIMACQLAAGWREELATPTTSDLHLSTYLKECVFAPGSRWPWTEVLQSATGQKLDPESLLRCWGAD